MSKEKFNCLTERNKNLLLKKVIYLYFFFAKKKKN